MPFLSDGGVGIHSAAKKYTWYIKSGLQNVSISILKSIKQKWQLKTKSKCFKQRCNKLIMFPFSSFSKNSIKLREDNRLIF